MLKDFATACVCAGDITTDLAVVTFGFLAGILIWWRGLLAESTQKVAGLILFSVSASALTTRSRAQTITDTAARTDSANCQVCNSGLFELITNEPIHFGLIFFGIFGATIITFSIFSYLVGLVRGK